MRHALLFAILLSLGCSSFAADDRDGTFIEPTYVTASDGTKLVMHCRAPKQTETVVFKKVAEIKPLLAEVVDLAAFENPNEKSGAVTTAAPAVIREVLHLNDESFPTQMSRAGLSLVDFNATWCGPCRKLGPVIEKIALEQNAVQMCKVDVDASPAIANEFKIHGIPCLILFRDGVEIDRCLGYRAKDEVLSFIAKNSNQKIELSEELPLRSAEPLMLASQPVCHTCGGGSWSPSTWQSNGCKPGCKGY